MSGDHNMYCSANNITPLRSTDESAEMALARIRKDAEDTGKKINGHVIVLIAEEGEMNITYIASAHRLALASIRLAHYANEILDEEAT